jgi:hypothetical protein
MLLTSVFVILGVILTTMAFALAAIWDRTWLSGVAIGSLFITMGALMGCAIALRSWKVAQKFRKLPA